MIIMIRPASVVAKKAAIATSIREATAKASVTALVAHLSVQQIANQIKTVPTMRYALGA